MRAEDFGKFKALMTSLSELYDKSPSESALKMYALALQEFTIEQVTVAVQRAVTELKFFPKPAELIELIQGSVGDRAEHAWQIAWEAYRRAGYYHSVIFEDGCIARTIQIVYAGWIQFSEASRTLSPEMFQARKKDFLATYRRESRHARAPERMPGHYEIENQNTVATWSRDKFGEFYTQQLYVAMEDGGRFVSANFRRSTAQLVESTVQLLNAAKVPELPAKPVLELLPPPPKPSDAARLMTPEEIKSGIQALIQSVKAR